MTARRTSLTTWSRARALTFVLALIAAMAIVAVGPVTSARADHTTITEGDGLVTSVRWAGVDRWETASKLAVEGTAAAVSTPAQSVIIARSADFPDALAGSYLSGGVVGPILLTARDELSQATRDRLTSTEASGLDVDTAYVLGLQNAIGDEVVAELESLGHRVVRIGGADRYETAALIARTAPDIEPGEVDGQTTAILATGQQYPDALVAGAPSRAGALPILLTRTDSLPEVTADTLTDLGIEQVVVAGLDNAVSPAVVAEVEALGIDVRRVGGDDRTGTAAAFASFNEDELDFTTDRVGLARGNDFADALAFGPYAGREKISIALTRAEDVIGDATPGLLSRLGTCTFDTLYIPGGTAAVSAGVEAQARDLLTADDCDGVDNTAPTMADVTATAVDGEPVGARTPAAAPQPGDDVVEVTYTEAVTCPDTVPQQFRHLADDGTATDATSLDCDGSSTVVLGFPGGTLGDPASGTIEYRIAGDPGLRVVDLAGNLAPSGDTAELMGTELRVTTTADTQDAAIGDGLCADSDGECSLRAAITEANATDGDEELVLPAGDYVLTRTGAGEDANATGDLDVTADLTIVGEGRGSTTIDANGIDRVFDLLGAHLELSGVTITGGDAPGDVVAGNVGSNGGGVFVDTDSQLTASDATFRDNTAARAGGAIENTEGVVRLLDVELLANSAGVNGGGLHLTGLGTAWVEDSLVRDNTADQEGGGLWNGSSSMTVMTSVLEDNTASGESADANQGGGNLFNAGGDLVVEGSTLRGGVADGANGSGGNVLTDGGTLEIATSTVANGSANRAGGGVELTGGAEATVTGTDFMGNDIDVPAPGVGGALHVSSGSATVVDSDVATNTAVNGGGMWVNAGATLDVVDSTFTGNTATGTGQRFGGGALFNNGGTLTVDGATITGNQAVGAAGSGGGILTLGALTVTDSTIDDNTANRAGGGIEVDSPAEGPIVGSATVTDTDLAGNDITTPAPGVGGGLHISTGSADVTGGLVEANAAVNGGGMWVNAGATLTVDGTTFVANEATGGGAATNGGGALFNNGGTLDVDGATFADNVAVVDAGSGGAIMTLGALDVDGSSFDGNQANRAGGAVEVVTTDQVVTLDGNIFTANDALSGPVMGAPGVGGAVHVTSGDVTVTDGEATGNTAALNGGAFWVNAGATLTVDGTTFTDNVADNEGGALYNNGGTLEVVDVDASTGNMADLGNVYGAGTVDGPVTTASGSLLEVPNAPGAACSDPIQDLGGNTNPDGTCFDGVPADGLFGVTTTDDTVDASIGDGVCADGDGECSLRAAVQEANADPDPNTIELVAGDYALTITGDEEDAAATGDLDVIEDVSILGDGADGTTIDGAALGDDRVFDVLGGTVVIADVTITGGNATGNPDNGLNNGGGINLRAGDLTVMDSVLDGNTANRAGGGIENTAGTLTVTDTDFTANVANINGGAIHASDSGTTSVTGGTVAANSAAQEGGGFWNGAGDMTVDGTSFDANTAAGPAADQGGGNLFNIGGTLTVTGADVDGGTATGASGSGGNVLLDGGTLTITDSTISNGSANRAGGGIESSDDAGTVVLTNVDFTTNTVGDAPGNGGAMHLSGASTADVTGGTVTGNTAALEGGGFWNSTATMSIVGTTFTGNTASGPAADDGGGALFNNGGTLVVTDAVLTDNVADGTSGSGGGILSLGGSLEVSGGSIDGGVANRAGGGIEVAGDGEADLTDVDFDGNAIGTANPGVGGALHVSSGTVTVQGGTVANNVAVEGGGFWVNAGPAEDPTAVVLSVIGTTFTANEATGAAGDQGGGAIYNNGGLLGLTSSTLTGNVASGAAGSGGGVLLLGDSTLIGNTIEDNTANRAGGGIEVAAQSETGVAPTVFVGGTEHSLSGNDIDVANPGVGGGLHVTAGTVTFADGDVDDNTAVNGGGMWVNDGAELTVTGATSFTGNEATGTGRGFGGGALFNNGGLLSVDGATMDGNTASGAAGSGGAILTLGELTVEDSTVATNTANRAGGGIEVDTDDPVTIDTVDLTGNSITTPMPGVGGGLHVTAGDVEVLGGTTSGNTAVDGGGMWVNANASLSVEGATFTDNTATGTGQRLGGGALFNNGGLLEVTGVSFDGNDATGAAGSGGAILTLGELTVTDADIDNGTANRAGGGIEVDTTADGTVPTVTITDVDFTGNGIDAANPGVGGALHVTAGDVDVSGGTVDGNSAVNGGAFWVNSDAAQTSSLTVTGTTFTNNTASGSGGALFNNGGVLELDTITAPGGDDANTSPAGNVYGQNDANAPDTSATGSTLEDPDVAGAACSDPITDGGGNTNPDGTCLGTGFQVTVATDSADANAGDGVCADAAGECSLRAAITEANADDTDNQIALGADTYTLTITGSQEDANATGDLDVLTDETVTITGAGEDVTTIDAASLGDRVFDVDGPDLVVTGVTVTGGTADDGDIGVQNGGAFLVTDGATLDLSASTLDGNSAPRAGGAIENTGQTVTITDVTFTDNAATAAGGAPGNGGAVHAAGGTTTIIGGTADGNTADEGGAFWIGGGGTMTVDGTTFTNNAALGNVDGPGGGALFNNGATLSVTNATVGTDGNGNTADSTTTVGSGGGLFHNGGTTTVDASTFTANSANRAGGGIELADVAGSVTVTDTDFADNTASGATSAGNGGALHTTNRPVSITGGEVTGNTAVEGGGFWNGSDTMTVDGVTFDGNAATGGDAGTPGARQGGGALYNNGGTLDVTDADFTSNTAVVGAGSGGAILNAGATAVLTVTDANFVGNTADRAGGAIENDLGDVDLTGTETDLADPALLTFTGNVATGANSAGNGGAVHDGGGTVAASNLLAFGNDAVQGGAFWTSGSTTLTNQVVQGNTAEGGGAFYNSGGAFTFVDVDANALLGGGTATTAGDVLFIEDGSTQSASGSTFTSGLGSTNDTCEAQTPADLPFASTEDGNTDDDGTCFAAAPI